MKAPITLRRAVAYARVSSKEQEESGFSIPAQMRLLHEYANAKGIQIAEEFIDVETAKQAGRTNFSRMIAFLAKRKSIRLVLVEKTDRLYRNFRDYVTLDELDLEIHLVKEGEVLSNESRSSQKFIHGIKVLMAKNYIDNLSEETKKGLAEKAAQGFFPGKAPVGYKNLRGPDGRHLVEIDPLKAEFVRKLFQRYVTGLHSLEDLRQMCIAEDFRPGTWGKRPISKSKVVYILTNIFYTGMFVWKGKLYEGKHPPIVSSALFDRAQEVLKGRAFKKVSRIRSFSGILTCGVCGCAICSQRAKGRYVYYKCTNYHGGCTEGYYREEDLAPKFDELVKAVTLDGEVVSWIKKALEESLGAETAYHEQAVLALSRRLEKTKQRLNQAYLDKLDGRIDEDFWRELTNDMHAEKARIIEELAQHQFADGKYLDHGQKLFEVARRAHELYQSSEPSEKQRLLKVLLLNCTLKAGALTPTYRPPIDMLVVMKKTAATVHPLVAPPDAVLQVWGG